MDFISNKESQVKELLTALGIENVEELFHAIPSDLRVIPPAVDDGLSEYEVLRHMENLASKNNYSSYENYLGAGAYEHHVPALVAAICSKSEFLTAYTPYQPEVSQGMLQAIFEFQSAICALTGMDVSNASLYDGASACAEAVLMALRHHKERNKVIIAANLHPHYRDVVQQYLSSHQISIVFVPLLENGNLDLKKLSDLMDDQTAAVLVSYPNFFGAIDDLKNVSQQAKVKESLTIVCANPLVYGLYASAKEIDADIAVGDCQPFGIPLQFGGPYVGYIACKEELVRQLPGRIAGETVDTKGRRGFVLTLQAREQHIRREKATSNICTNQALAALASLIAMLWYGKKGVKELALTNFQRTMYLREQLKKISGVEILFDGSCFNEFAYKTTRDVAKVQEYFRKNGIEPGLDLGQFYPEFKNYLLVAVTETKTVEQLDRYVSVLKDLLDKS